MSEYTIRIMTRQELDVAVEWAATEGWNPGLHDAGCFHAADNAGFLVGLLGDEPIATISAVRYGDSFGFLGFYIVRPEYRGHGYGIRIWNAAMEYLQGRTIGLDGVVAQQDNYRKSGFELAYRNIRFEGRGGGTLAAESGIRPFGADDLEDVLAYDRPFFPAQREAFLRCWLVQPQGVSLVAHRDGRLAGYGVVRPCRAGYKIGPLFADDAELAEQLFQALKARVAEGVALYLDVPEVNAAAVALAQRHNMQRVFETARMYTGIAPILPVERLFGVTTFELG